MTISSHNRTKSLFAILALVACAGLGTLLLTPTGTSAQEDGEQFTERELDRNPALTPARRRLILAYENYIELFPRDTTSKIYLANIAAQFQDVGDWETTIQVYERYLGRQDLTQSDRAYAYEQVMDSYQSLEQFDKQLEWAHRMARADVGRTKQLEAKERIFLAGYNQARTLEENGETLAAAAAYSDLAVKNPDHSQASTAMLRSAQLYEQADQPLTAAQTYERFYYTYPDWTDAEGHSALMALETAATIYHEQQDRRHTADAIERILAAKPDHENRKSYLNNLAAIYQLLKDHNNAIRIRQTFIEDYPDDPKSGGYLWDIARLRGEAGQRSQQLAEYERFLRNYPNDPHSIEANYIVGVNRLDRRENALEDGNTMEADALLDAARIHFVSAYTLHDTLEAASPNSGDLPRALLSAIEVADMDSAVYQSISLVETDNFTRDSTRKWDALKSAASMYMKIAAYQYVPVMFEALYRRGQLFEDFAVQYLKQPRPDTAITYDQIEAVFFINTVAETFLRQLALEESYEKNITNFYDANRARIDSAAATSEPLPDMEIVLNAHEFWIEQARNRIATIPERVDSLRFNTIGYQADLLVMQAADKIPETFNNAWPKWVQTQGSRYSDNPRLEYGDKLAVFDQFVAPMVYGRSREAALTSSNGDTSTAGMVQEFQKIIADGKRLRATQQWIDYNRGRLRLVYAARTNYFSLTVGQGITGLGKQLDTLRYSSNEMANIIESLPEPDFSSLGDMPEPPSTEIPPAPQMPPGGLPSMTQEEKLAFLQSFRAWKTEVDNIRWRVTVYQRRVRRYKERQQSLVEQFRNQHRETVESATAQFRNFTEQNRETQFYRIYIERNVVDIARAAHEKNIAFGDSVGYPPEDRRAVRDSAMADAMAFAQRLDSIYAVSEGIRREYEQRRNTAKGGEGSLAFQFIGNLVTPYAAMADSFRQTAIRAYEYIYDGRDSLFTAGLENPTVQMALERLKALDPTFGERMVTMHFTFVTEDSSGMWVASTEIDKEHPDAWKQRTFDDGNWLPAQAARMEAGLASAAEPAAAPDTVSTSESDTLGYASTGNDSLASPSIAAAPMETGIIGFPETGNVNMTDIWAPVPADQPDSVYQDTAYLRYKVNFPPRFSELPDSLRLRERPIPIIKSAKITLTADDDYFVFVNGEITNAYQAPTGRNDWNTAVTVPLLTDKFFVGDTANVFAVMAINETAIDRYPMTNVSSYGFMARIDVEMQIPLDIWEILYKPPEPEPVFTMALTHQDSVMLADTTGRYFLTSVERNQWLECRMKAIEETWKDTVLYPWRLNKAETQITELDTTNARLYRWLIAAGREASHRLAEQAGAMVGGAGFGDTGMPASPDTSGMEPYNGTGENYDDTGGSGTFNDTGGTGYEDTGGSDTSGMYDDTGTGSYDDTGADDAGATEPPPDETGTEPAPDDGSSGTESTDDGGWEDLGQ